MSASSKKKLRKELEAAQLTEKQQSERKEAKKLKVYSVTFIAVVSVILVAALCLAAFSLISGSGILPRTVKAVTIGSHTLTSAELNYFYVDAVNSAYNDWKESFGDYIDLGLAYNGLTVGKPLDQQQHPLNADQTWAEYFADVAVQDATSAYALYDAAMAAGHQLSEQSAADQEMMIEIMGYYAAAGGYANTEEYIKGTYGNGATLESYKNYMHVTALGTDYANTFYQGLEYTAEEIDAYNKEHTADFNSYSYSQFYVDRDDFLLCTDPENKEHVHTADEYAPALKAAKEAADKLAASGAATEEDLNAKITEIEIYKDTNFKADTYTDQLMQTMKENVREEITDWLLDGTHKAGEMAVLSIPTEVGGEELDGYLVILFHGMKENNENLVNVRHILFQFPNNASTEDKAATKKKAEDLQTKWLAEGGTEEAFIALVKDNSEDTGSKENGGLYEDVYPGQMVTAFNDWCFDADRKTGDYEIVETEYGYHLMYYVSTSETTFRNFMVENTLRNNEYNDWTTGLVEKLTADVHSIKYLDLDMAISSAQ